MQPSKFSERNFHNPTPQGYETYRVSERQKICINCRRRLCASGPAGPSQRMKNRKKLIMCSVGAVLAIVASQHKGELRTSEEGLKLITNYESCTLNAYQCQAGKWTNGVGHTGDVNPNVVITLEQAATNLVKDVKVAEACVSRYSKTELTQGKFDAFVSLTMNAGCGTFSKSSMAKDGKCETLLQYNKYTDPASKKKIVSTGLDNRRKKEYALCVKN